MEFNPEITILVVDDEVDMRDMMALALASDGFQTDVAADGNQALEKLNERHYDLVVCDLVMPELDGLDVLAEVKRRAPDTLFILVTAHASVESAVAALRQGAYDYLLKPFDIDELSLTVQRALSHRQLMLEKEQLLKDLQEQNISLTQTHAQVRQRAEALSDMLEASNHLAHVDRHTESLGREVAQIASQHFDMRIGITAIDEENKQLRPLYLDDLPDAWKEMLNKQQFTPDNWPQFVASAAPINQSYYLDPQMIDPQAESRPPWAEANLRQEDGALLAVPLETSEGHLVGVLWMSCPEDHPPLESVQRLQIFGNQVAAVIENTNLLSGLVNQLRARDALFDMTQRIVTTLNQQDVLESTLEATLKTIPQADWVTIHYRPTEESDIISESLQSTRRKKIAKDIDLALLEEVMQQRSPSYLPEYAPSPKATPGSLLILPMLLANTATGTLSIASRRTHAFSDDQQQLLVILANQAAIALQNAHLYAEARRIDGLEALRDVSKSIITTLDLTQVLELIVSSAAATIPATAHSALYLLSQPGNEFSLKASSSRPGSQSAEGIDEALDRVIDQATEQRTIAYETSVRDQNSVWSLLAAPLITGDNILGAICLESPHADAFSDDDRVLLSAFADQASIAIQNASLFQDLSSAYVDLASSREEILRSRNVLQALFDGITDGLYIVNREMEIVAVNQAEAQRLNLSPDELQGRVCDESLWEEAAEKLCHMIQLALDTEAEQSWPSQTDAPNRGPFTNQNIHVYPILSASGPAQRAIVFAQDVSEMRQLQASLFRSANLAAIGQLAASIAHEINNPLTVVTGNAQLLQMEINKSDPNYELTNRIRESGARMQRIVQNLLDFSSQETYQFDWIEVEETIDDALALIAHPLRKANIQVRKDLTGLPLIHASASHLKLIWMNLLLNARDAIHQREGEGEIRIGAESTSDTLSILITDDGVGIPAEHFEHLFRPFFTTKPPGKGLGLGLYTCHAIVARHQGKIHIESQPGQGTIVRVSLPIEHTSDEVQQPE